MRVTRKPRSTRRFLSTKEVAQALAVRPTTVRAWIASGELPASKLHRQWRIAAEDLAELLGAELDGE